jgi:hypothetical protein
MPKYEVLGKNTDIGSGSRLEAGAIIKDDRDLVRMFPGKFRVLKMGAKKVEADDDEEKEDIQDTTPKRDKTAVIDGGPTQPSPPNKGTDQNMRNAGVRGERIGPDGKKQELLNAPGRKANPMTGKGGEEGDPSGEAGEEGEEGAENPKSAKKVGKRRRTAEAEEEEDYHDVTKDFPEAKKADLAVFEYPGSGEFQIFDSDDADNPDAKPVNDGPLKTSKKVKEFLKKYHA